ncbi:MAG: DUF3052 family protein, partial [Candidatus Nanopelagicales bacterium]
KLGVKPGYVVRVLSCPKDVDVVRLLQPLAAGASIVHRRTKKNPEIVVCFAESARELQVSLPKAIEAIARDGAVWVFWPKKSSLRFKSGSRDITEDTIRVCAIELGVVDVKVCAVDETWSGLKLVYRLADR